MQFEVILVYLLNYLIILECGPIFGVFIFLFIVSLFFNILLFFIIISTLNYFFYIDNYFIF